MNVRSTWTPCHALLLVALALPAAAQDGADAPPGPSDKERKAAAKREQAERRKEKDAERLAETSEAEEAREKARRERSGLDEDVVLPDEERGFLLRVEAAWMSLGGVDRTVAHVGDIATSAATAEELDSDGDELPDAFTVTGVRPLRLAYGTPMTGRIEIGWRFARRGALSLRYWNASESASLAAESSRVFSSSTGGADLRLGGIDNIGQENEAGLHDTNPGLFDRPFGSPTLVVTNRLHGADSITATGSFDASRFDLLYSRAGLARKRFELGYRAGLSMAELTREESATLTWTSFSQPQVGLESRSVETIAASSSTDGIGAMAGIAGRFDLSADRRWGVRLGLDVAGLAASHDLKFRDGQYFTQPILVPPPPEQVFHDTKGDGGSRLLTIVDAEVAVEARLRKVQVTVGYGRSWWLDALTEERYPSATNRSLLDQRTGDVDFGGPFLRVGFNF